MLATSRPKPDALPKLANPGLAARSGVPATDPNRLPEPPLDAAPNPKDDDVRVFVAEAAASGSLEAAPPEVTPPPGAGASSVLLEIAPPTLSPTNWTRSSSRTAVTCADCASFGAVIAGVLAPVVTMDI